jgi:hypothetical protein
MPRVARVGATQLMLLVDGAIAAVLVRGDPKMAGAARATARFLLIAAGRAADPSDAPVRDHFRCRPFASFRCNAATCPELGEDRTPRGLFGL